MSDIEVGEVFTLSDENNEEQEVEVLGAMDVEGAEYIAVAFVEDIQTETEEDIDIFFLKVEEDSEFSYIENDEEFEKYLLRLKRFWMSKSKNRMKHTRTDAYPPSFIFTHPKIYAAIPVHLSSQRTVFLHAQQIQKRDVVYSHFQPDALLKHFQQKA